MEDKTPPAQHQDQQPGREQAMDPKPIYISDDYKSADKLQGKVAIITGGDSGIGRAVAVHYAKEGARVMLVYLEEHDDAEITCKEIERQGGEVIAKTGDIGQKSVCDAIVREAMEAWGQIDILVNNAGEQHPTKNIEDISEEQLLKTFQTNIFSIFYLTQAAIPHMKAGSTIINTTSVTAYNGQPILLDYSATKGAITAFTRSLSINLAEKGIRVNGVAPGPVWTPLIPSTFTAEQVAEFGGNTPMKRPGQPAELAPAYVYLACQDSSYVSGQVIHINGGTIVSG